VFKLTLARNLTVLYGCKPPLGTAPSAVPVKRRDTVSLPAWSDEAGPNEICSGMRQENLYGTIMGGDLTCSVNEIVGCDLAFKLTP